MTHHPTHHRTHHPTPLGDKAEKKQNITPIRTPRHPPQKPPSGEIRNNQAKDPEAVSLPGGTGGSKNHGRTAPSETPQSPSDLPSDFLRDFLNGEVVGLRSQIEELDEMRAAVAEDIEHYVCLLADAEDELVEVEAEKAKKLGLLERELISSAVVGVGQQTLDGQLVVGFEVCKEALDLRVLVERMEEGNG